MAREASVRASSVFNDNAAGSQAGSDNGSDDGSTAEALELPDSFATREEGIRFCFDYVDKDRSGSLDRSEFRTIATRVNPQSNLREAEEMLTKMDADRDGLVDWEEFKIAFGSLTNSMSDDEFMLAVRKNVVKDEAVQEGYIHPQKSRRYLQKTYINAVLSEGLEELVHTIYRNRVDLASGTLWDEQGYLPRGYQPLNPLEFLGNFVIDQLRKAEERKEAFAAQERKRVEVAELELDKPFRELTDLGKLRLLWNSLVPEGHNDINSSIPIRDVQEMGKNLGYPGTMVDGILERMGYLEDEDENEELEFFEFEAVFDKLTEDFMPEEVDSYIMIQLGAPHLKHYDSRQKAQLVFAKLDEDRSGELELNEIVLLAKMLDPMAEEARIKKAVAYLDTDNSETVDSREFVEAMSRIFDNTDTAHVDAAITKILEIGVDAMDLATCHMSKALKAYVRGHASHKMAEQLGVKSVQEKVDDPDVKVIFVDVRGEEEVNVSSIAGAVSVPAKPGSKSKAGFSISSALEGIPEATLLEMMDDSEEQPTVVIIYDTAGTRAASVASQLSQHLHGKTVYNMCGGLIEWYNKGGEVVDGTGEAVEAIHPYQRELLPFIERHNSYKMPGADAKKSAMKSSKSTKPSVKSPKK